MFILLIIVAWIEYCLLLAALYWMIVARCERDLWRHTAEHWRKYAMELLASRRRWKESCERLQAILESRPDDPADYWKNKP